MNEEEILLLYVARLCSENPSLHRKVVDAATEGVKQFAEKQKDFGSKLGFAMSAVVDSTTQDSFGPFSRQDLIQMTKPWLEGTTWWKENNKQGIDI
jgi:hypothetical protein